MTRGKNRAFGTALVCDADATVVRIIRDDLGLARHLKVGSPLTRAVGRRSFAEALTFLANLRARGATMGWELAVPNPAQAERLYFAGVALAEQWLILAARSVADIVPLCDELPTDEPESVAEACGTLRILAEQAGSTPVSEVNVCDEISRLNNELVNVRRRLEKQMAERTSELRRSEQRFRSLFEQADLGIALVDTDGRVLDVNRSFLDITAQGEARLIGLPIDGLFRSLAENSEALELHWALLSGEQEHFRSELRCKGQGQRHRWLSVRGSLVRAESGKPAFLLYLLADDTERRQTQAALLQAERLSIAGKLAASLAHEINNPLQSVVGFLGLAAEDLADGRDVSRYVDLALQELRRVARIVGELRNLQRPSPLEERQPGDVNIILDQVIALSRAKFEESAIECVWTPTPHLPLLSLVPDRMKQVFLNLILNAVQAMPDGGTLEITTAVTDQPPGVSTVFTDTGPGIGSDMLPLLFGPFFTTKADGLGLGLFISHEIINQHGGRIDVQSTPGQGASFSVWLPA
jgi:PAS domain S-box-containing protein